MSSKTLYAIKFGACTIFGAMLGGLIKNSLDGKQIDWLENVEVAVLAAVFVFAVVRFTKLFNG